MGAQGVCEEKGGRDTQELKIEAITFDAFGTLLDPMGTTWDAIQEILIKGHADADAEDFFGWVMDRVRASSSEPPFRSYLQLYREHLTAAFQEFGVAGTPEDAELIFVHHRRRKPYDEIPEALAALQARFRTGVVSNADTGPLRWNFQEAGLQFEFIITSEFMRAYKPSPVLFEEALQRLKLDPAQIAHVGDSPTEDIAPAKALGMTAIWLNRQGQEYPADAPEPDCAITGLGELRGIVV